MARVIEEYRGWRLELVRESRDSGWRYRVASPAVPSGPAPFVTLHGDVGEFASSAAAYQDAVRRINLLTTALWDFAR